MTDKITLELTLDELKELDKNLYYCEETWSICDKIRNAYPKSPVVEAYKDWWGDYPELETDSQYDDTRWAGFQAGYEFAYKEKVSEEPEEQKWDAVRESVKWCEENAGKNPLDWVKPQTPEQVADGLKEAFREAVKQGVVSSTKPKTLTDLIYRWWDDIFTTHSSRGMETSIDDLVSRIEAWLPEEHCTNSYKWNQCIKTIKEKLR